MTKEHPRVYKALLDGKVSWGLRLFGADADGVIAEADLLKYIAYKLSNWADPAFMPEVGRRLTIEYGGEEAGA